MKEHLLCALDEFVVGFAVDHSQGKNRGVRSIFSKTGALVVDSRGQPSSEYPPSVNSINYDISNLQFK